MKTPQEAAKKVTLYQKGMKVNYKGRENGMVKRQQGDIVFVVYNCGGEWSNFENYTAAATNTRDLKYGWI